MGKVVLQGSILFSTLSDVFISGLDGSIRCTLRNFAEHTQVGKWALWESHREDLDRLEHWANLMKFSKDKCKVLRLGKQNPGVQHRLESTHLKSSSVERVLGVPVDNTFPMSDQSPSTAKKANRILGCIKKDIPTREKISQSTQHLSGTTWNAVYNFGPCYTKQKYTGWKGPKKSHKDN